MLTEINSQEGEGGEGEREKLDVIVANLMADTVLGSDGSGVSCGDEREEEEEKEKEEEEEEEKKEEEEEEDSKGEEGRAAISMHVRHLNYLLSMHTPVNAEVTFCACCVCWGDSGQNSLHCMW